MESIPNLLRPNQREELETDKKGLQASLNEPGLTDRGAALSKIRQVDRQLETQSPKEYPSDQIDAAVKREKVLREEMLVGMPTHEEMRKSPPGAVGKHESWEARNKKKILEWKHIKLRLDHGSKDRDVANFEKYRPSSNTLSMDNAFIQGQQYHMSPPTAQYQESYENIFKHGKPLAEMSPAELRAMADKIDGGTETKVKVKRKRKAKSKKKR